MHKQTLNFKKMDKDLNTRITKLDSEGLGLPGNFARKSVLF